MDALEHARAEIDEVDAQLAALFERRMAAVLQVAEYKRAHGLPIFDAAREAAVLEKAAARIHAPALRPYYKDHVQNMMDVAKQYEALILGQNRAAYQGVEGAFAHIALRALFPHAEAVSCPTWDEVFAAVERGDAAHGVVPFENSHGSLNHVSRKSIGIHVKRNFTARSERQHSQPSRRNNRANGRYVCIT